VRRGSDKQCRSTTERSTTPLLRTDGRWLGGKSDSHRPQRHTGRRNLGTTRTDEACLTPVPRFSAWWRGRAIPVVDLAAQLDLTLRRRQQPTRLIITRTQNAAAPLIGFLSSADIRTDRNDLETARQSEDHSARPDSRLGAFHLGVSTVLIPDLHRVLLA